MRLLLFLVMMMAGLHAAAQMTVRGTVYDRTKTNRVEFVQVYSTNGTFTQTDSLGNFRIRVNNNDSLYFVYNHKPSKKFAVSQSDPENFEVSLAITAPPRASFLAPVKVTSSYRQDSIENREHFAKVFNYVPNKVDVSYTGTGVGANLDDLINLFRYKRKKELKQFRLRLEDIERDAFIRQRFSRPTIVKLTGLKGSDLDNFMNEYLPSYDFALKASPNEMTDYINLAFEKYQQKRGLRK